MFDLSKLTVLLEGEGFRPASYMVNFKVAYHGVMEIGGLKVPLSIHFNPGCDDFPSVYIENWSERADLKAALGCRHIMPNGLICYVDPTQAWWDTPGALGATLGVLQRIRDILNGNQSGVDVSDDILRDFGGYWGTRRRVYLAQIPGNGDQVFSLMDKHNREWIVKSPALAWLHDAKPFHKHQWTACQISKAPPIRGENWPPSNLAQLIYWFKSAGHSMQWLVNALHQNSKDVPHKQGHKQNKSTRIGLLMWWHDELTLGPHYSAVEFTLENKLLRQVQSTTRHKGIIALLGRCTYIPIERIAVERADPKYLHTRNLPQEYQLDQLHKAKVVLIGAGTIGGYLAQQLANLGVGLEGELLIVDPDILKPGNVGRHILGVQHIGLHKAEACANNIKQNYPYLNINHRTKHVQEIASLMLCDVLINASGDQTTGVALAMMARNCKKRPLILDTWVVGQGLAAQALLRRPGENTDACYRCVCNNEHTDCAMHSERFRVAKDSSKLGTIFGPCHESFYPFVSNASATAANLAVGMLTDFYRGLQTKRMRTVILREEYCQKRPDANPERWGSCPVCSR